MGGGGQRRGGGGRAPAMMSTLKFFHKKKLKIIVEEPDIHKMPKKVSLKFSNYVQRSVCMFSVERSGHSLTEDQT